MSVVKRQIIGELLVKFPRQVYFSVNDVKHRAIYYPQQLCFLLAAKPVLGRSLFFTPKQVFGHRTAKSQPIWIKFCTHLLLYRIHS